MKRKILHRRKKIVEVETLHRKDGVVVPLAVRWDDGRVFEVRKVLKIARAPKRGSDGGDIRYTVVIAGKESQLHYDPPLWFVDEKVYGATAGGIEGYDDSHDGARTYGKESR